MELAEARNIDKKSSFVKVGDSHRELDASIMSEWPFVWSSWI
jgi:hypothetical protein